MKVLKSISSGVLAFTLLFSAAGLSLVTHYCMGEVKKVSLNKNEQTSTCHKVEQPPSCHQAAENNCCDNEQEEIKTDDYSVTAKIKLDHAADYAVIDLPLLNDLQHSVRDNTGFVSFNYSINGPPDDRQAVLQVFII